MCCSGSVVLATSRSRLDWASRPGLQTGGQFAAVPVLVVVALKCALELAVAGRYGWHRDELYYAVAGLHLQGGYVEFPPARPSSPRSTARSSAGRSSACGPPPSPRAREPSWWRPSSLASSERRAARRRSRPSW